MEEEFIKNQERLKPQEEKQEVCFDDKLIISMLIIMIIYVNLLGAWDGFLFACHIKSSCCWKIVLILTN